MAGQKRCRMHGGSSPNALAAAERRLAVLDAARQVQAWGGRLDVTPPEALLELVQTKAAEVAYWQRLVRGLGEGERAGMLEVKSEFGFGPQGPVDTTTKQASAHIYLTLLHKAQDQLASYSAAALKAGVDQAMVNLATMQAAWLVPFAVRLIAEARHDPTVNPQDLIRLALEAAR